MKTSYPLPFRKHREVNGHPGAVVTVEAQPAALGGNVLILEPPGFTPDELSIFFGIAIRNEFISSAQLVLRNDKGANGNRSRGVRCIDDLARDSAPVKDVSGTRGTVDDAEVGDGRCASSAGVEGDGRRVCLTATGCRAEVCCQNLLAGIAGVVRLARGNPGAGIIESRGPQPEVDVCRFRERAITQVVVEDFVF
jgi:hypothetical protein